MSRLAVRQSAETPFECKQPSSLPARNWASRYCSRRMPQQNTRARSPSSSANVLMLSSSLQPLPTAPTGA